MADDLVMYENQIIIPTVLRKDMIKKIHNSHLGMSKCKERARTVIYWPRMSQDIEDYVANCEICAKFKDSNQREPMISHDIPDRPWSKLGADIRYRYFTWMEKIIY